MKTPTIEKIQDTKRYAMGIVNQLYDLAEVDPNKRQSINDQADEYVTERLETYKNYFNPTYKPLSELHLDREEIVDQIKALESAHQCIKDVVDAYSRDCSRVVLDEAIKSLRDDAGKLVSKVLVKHQTKRDGYPD